MAATPSVFDVATLGKPPQTRLKRRHVRSLTGYYIHIPYFHPILIHHFLQVITLKSTKRAKKNGQRVMRRFGKLPCATFTKVTFPLSTCIVLRETEPTAEVPEITQSIVHHVQTSLGRAPYNLDDFGAYQAASLSVRDNLIVSPWSSLPSHCVPGSWLESLSIAVYLSTSFLFLFLFGSSRLTRGVSLKLTCLNPGKLERDSTRIHAQGS